MEEARFSVRAYEEATDEPFVVGAWVEANRHAPGFREVPRSIYAVEERRRVAQLVRHSEVRVAHVAGEPSAIVGFACLIGGVKVPTILHYVYVKRPARRLGIASLLLHDRLLVAGGDLGIQFTHLPVVRGLAIPAWASYNPYLRGA